MTKALLFLVGLLALLALLASTASAYNLVHTYQGNGFYNDFVYENFADPTHGYVYYTSRQQAMDWGLTSVVNGQARISADSTTISSGSGRAAVRLRSNASYTTGLFVLDVAHMPTGCGTWPAFWLVGPNWPYGGEIDIIEGVNNQVKDQTTLHTNPGCTMYGQDPTAFDGYFASQDCQGFNGCGIVQNGANYGQNLNQQGGGIYAMQWTNQQISAWFFPRGQVPGDLANGNPTPWTWPRPYARFNLGSNCDPSHFHDHNIIINLTFCGDWAGAVFGQQCPNMGSCNSFVQNNPGAFAEAYWLINSIKVWQ